MGAYLPVYTDDSTRHLVRLRKDQHYFGVWLVKSPAPVPEGSKMHRPTRRPSSAAGQTLRFQGSASDSCASTSMPEMPHARKHHSHPELVCRRDHVLILDRAAGLDDRCRAGRCDSFKAIREREERIRGGNG